MAGVRRHALVIGAGLAGPATALFLRKVGITSTLYESRPQAQPLGGGMVRRKVWVSQSPQMIQRLVEQAVSPQGGLYNCDAVPFPTRARAELAAENWIRGY